MRADPRRRRSYVVVRHQLVQLFARGRGVVECLSDLGGESVEADFALAQDGPIPCGVDFVFAVVVCKLCKLVGKIGLVHFAIVAVVRGIDGGGEFFQLQSALFAVHLQFLAAPPQLCTQIPAAPTK